jgi:hypothetical protein
LFAHHGVSLLSSEQTLDGEVTIDNTIEDRTCPLPSSTISLWECRITKRFEKVIHCLFYRKNVSIEK